MNNRRIRIMNKTMPYLGTFVRVIAVGDAIADIRATERVFFVMKEGVVYRNDRKH